MALLRLAVVGVIGLSVVYLLMWIYARSVRREQLEKDWAADHPDGGDPDAREAFIETGVKDYEPGLRRRLIIFVFILPAVAVAAILFVTNYQ
ncbi:MAG: hypothetical protein H6897_05255 [Rhodobacteraceae bacterium]|nr:hypothetical protein [Paracoccaceae bacterium]MCC0069321.1 hypothetical protein [Paracoccaceae bacterium]